MQEKIRNTAIIAHVDHGKTTLVDQLFRQCDSVSDKVSRLERIMDSNPLEKERGITILAKNTAIKWRDYKINIVDTPGHADFGGEVERILSMVDSVLLLVDAVDGPMPQTRFVTEKAFSYGLKPIVVINKIDRPEARPAWVINEVFDLFANLGATDEQLDFPVVYASAINGIATLDLNAPGKDLTPLFETIVKHVAPPQGDINGPLQLQISSLDYSDYLGVIGIGRINRGIIKPAMKVVVVNSTGEMRSGKISQVLGYHGLDRYEMQEAFAGDIVAISGIEDLYISETLCDPQFPAEPLPALKIDDPTITMVFQVNDSPFAGREGKFITSRQLRARLEKEVKHNIALRVEEMEEKDKFRVSGRGELHIGVLLETLRREGYELAISRPEVILKQEGDVILEPYEQLVVEVEERHQGSVMQQLGMRKAEMKNMHHDSKGRIRLEYIIPTKSLMGFHSLFQSLTSGTGIITHVFSHYAAVSSTEIERTNGVMISNSAGVATAYAIWNLQPRGKMFIIPQTEVYEGMIIGIHSRDNDLVVNVTKEKKLTNIRAAGSDENIILTPPIRLTIEYALEFIEKDELIEITPTALRLRKKFLKEHERKRSS